MMNMDIWRLSMTLKPQLWEVNPGSRISITHSILPSSESWKMDDAGTDPCLAEATSFPELK